VHERVKEKKGGAEMCLSCTFSVGAVGGEELPLFIFIF
jgi:hypothetical protein